MPGSWLASVPYIVGVNSRYKRIIPYCMRISLVVPGEVEVQGLAIGFIPSMYLCFSPAWIYNGKSPLNIHASEGSIRCSLVMPAEFSVDGAEYFKSAQ